VHRPLETIARTVAFRTPQDDVVVAFARRAQRLELGQDARIEPNQSVAVGVGLSLVVYRPERHCRQDRVERQKRHLWNNPVQIAFSNQGALKKAK
jgi:hypothetical protein